MQKDKTEQHTENRNTVFDSSLSAGNDIHIGDNHIHQHLTIGHTNNRRQFGWLAAGLVFMIILGLAMFYYWQQGTYQKPVPTMSVVNPVVANKDTLHEPNMTSRTTGDTRQDKIQPKSQPQLILLAQGILMDAETGAPLEGVQVTAVGLGGEAVTNETGAFTLRVLQQPLYNEYRIKYYKTGYETIVETHYQIPKTINKKLLKLPNNNISEK